MLLSTGGTFITLSILRTWRWNPWYPHIPDPDWSLGNTVLLYSVLKKARQTGHKGYRCTTGQQGSWKRASLSDIVGTLNHHQPTEISAADNWRRVMGLRGQSLIGASSALMSLIFFSRLSLLGNIRDSLLALTDGPLVSCSTTNWCSQKNGTNNILLWCFEIYPYIFLCYFWA